MLLSGTQKYQPKMDVSNSGLKAALNPNPALKRGRARPLHSTKPVSGMEMGTSTEEVPTLIFYWCTRESESRHWIESIQLF